MSNRLLTVSHGPSVCPWQAVVMCACWRSAQSQNRFVSPLIIIDHELRGLELNVYKKHKKTKRGRGEEMKCTFTRTHSIRSHADITHPTLISWFATLFDVRSICIYLRWDLCFSFAVRSVWFKWDLYVLFEEREVFYLRWDLCHLMWIFIGGENYMFYSRWDLYF